MILTHTSFQIDVPVFDRFDYYLQLVGTPVLLVVLFTTFFQLDDFHIGSVMSVRVYYETGRPAACNVVIEQSRQVGGAVVILACPFRCIVHSQPVCNLEVELTIQCVAVKLIFAVAQQTKLVQEVTAQHVSHFV